jgi:hypothetical protein
MNTFSHAPHDGREHDSSLMLLPDLIEAWRARFVNRPRPYAVQQEDGTYRWIHRPVDTGVFAEHLLGSTTIALSSLGDDGTCRWVCLDADAPHAFPQLMLLAPALTERGLPAFVEASRRGGHLWFIFDDPIRASLARRLASQALEELSTSGLSVPSLEVYPNTAVPGALGHAVRLPLGIHRLTNKRYPLFDGNGIPCALTSTGAAIHFLLVWPGISYQQVLGYVQKASTRRRRRPLPSPDREPGVARDSMDNDHMPAEHARVARPANGETHASYASCEASVASCAPVHVGTHSPVIRWVDTHVAVPDLLAELAPFTELKKIGHGYLGWCPFHDDRAPDEQGRPGTPSFYAVLDRRHGWSWRCYSTICTQSVGPLRHSFRLLQDLLEFTASQAIREACARWPEADAMKAKSAEGDPT